MLCDNCKKNEATIHIKEVHNGKVVASNLCAECAREKEEKGELGSLGFNLAEVLFNLGKLTESVQAAQEKRPPEPDADPGPVCPGCGWTLERVRESGGRLGCPDCYRTFAPMIADALTRVQRGPVHLGKRPQSAGPGNRAALQFEIDKLRRDLEGHIQREEYEEAAVCRDRIAQLKAELETRPESAGDGAGEGRGDE